LEEGGGGKSGGEGALASREKANYVTPPPRVQPSGKDFRGKGEVRIMRRSPSSEIKRKPKSPKGSHH